MGFLVFIKILLPLYKLSNICPVTADITHTQTYTPSTASDG